MRRGVRDARGRVFERRRPGGWDSKAPDGKKTRRDENALMRFGARAAGTRRGEYDDFSKEEENNENELGMLEFIHTLVETMDKWAGSICELGKFPFVVTGKRFSLFLPCYIFLEVRCQ